MKDMQDTIDCERKHFEVIIQKLRKENVETLKKVTMWQEVNYTRCLG